MFVSIVFFLLYFFFGLQSLTSGKRNQMLISVHTVMTVET